MAIVLLLIAVGMSTIPILKEDCGLGYFEYTKDALSDADGKKFFSFVEDNICGKCLHENCASCQESQGERCDFCSSGHFMLEEGFCAKCESDYDACLECENNQICKTCRNGYTMRDFVLDDGILRR